MKKILILAPYPLKCAPSQRFRFEHYLTFIHEKGIEYDFQSFFSVKAWNSLYQKGHVLGKVLGVLGGFMRRFGILFQLSRYHYVFLHREASPLGPPVFEFLITKVFRKRLIYDFDDAIWLPDPNHENPVLRWFKWRSKIATVCSWSYIVTPGNHYLNAFASRFCPTTHIIPTVVDTSAHQPHPRREGEKITIGWTGSHSTLSYLNAIIPILQELEKEIEFNFLVIANKNPHLPLRYFQFKEWNKATEIQDLSLMDIGIMPLEDNEWSKGKCGFKLIQYLALGIPAVANPVGVNTDLIIQDETGLLAQSSSEWIDALKTLIRNPQLRKKIGKNGRHLIVSRYSVESTKEKFSDLFSA